MIMAQKSHNRLSAAFLLGWLPAFLLTGCSYISLPWSTDSARPNATAEALYKEGMGYFNNKKYVAAIDRFQRLRADYPFAPEIVAAELKLGEAYYLDRKSTRLNSSHIQKSRMPSSA